MRITFVATPYPWRPVGALRVVYEYGNRLAACGHEVTIVHGNCRELGSPPPRPNGLARRLRSAAYAWRDRLMKPSIRWHVLDSRIRLAYVNEPFPGTIPDGDAVIASVWGTVGYVRQYPKEKGEKFQLIQGYPVDYGYSQDIVRDAWTAPVHNILVSKWLYALAEQMGCPDNRYIPNGIDSKKYRLIRPLVERPLRVVMLFHTVECKGSADGIRALEIARQKYPRLKAVLFSAQARPADLPPWVEFHFDPPQDYLVEQIYNGSRIFLCPSWSEGFALPPAEAMACGCALVSTDCGGNLDYAEHEETALLSPPRNPEMLAANLLRILDDDAFRVGIAQAGVKRIGQFSWGKSATAFEKAIQESLRQSQP